MDDFIKNIFKKYKRIIKYLIAGGTGTAVNLVLLYFFTDILDIWYLVSACLAFVLSLLVSFFLQKFWTFDDTGRDAMHRQMMAFLLVATINFFLNGLLMVLFVEVFKAWYMLAQFLINGLIAIESYFVYKLFIFNQGVKPEKTV